MGFATRRCYARACCRKSVSARRPARCHEIRTRLGPKQVVELKMMVRLGHAHGRGERCAYGDAQQSCRFAWLKGTEPAAPRNTEHALLTCIVTLEKIVCDQQATRRWALERAIVIFSGHAQSIVRTLALSGLRWPTRRRHASTVRYRVACTCTQRLFGPQQRCAGPTRAEGGATLDLLRRVGAPHISCVSQKMDRPK
jgi:hypothetical protein